MAGSILDCYDAELGAFVDELAGDFDFPSTMEREGVAGAPVDAGRRGGRLGRRSWRRRWRASGARGSGSCRSSRLRRGRSRRGSGASARTRPARSGRPCGRRCSRRSRRGSPRTSGGSRSTSGSLPGGVCYGRGLWRPAPSPLPMGGLSGVKPGGSGLTLGVAPCGGEWAGTRRRASARTRTPGPSRSRSAPSSPTRAPRTSGRRPRRPCSTTLGAAGRRRYGSPWARTRGSTGIASRRPRPGSRGARIRRAIPRSWRCGSPPGSGTRAATSSRTRARSPSHWKQWRSTTAPLVRALPASSQVAGTLYRDGERLRVFQGSEELAGRQRAAWVRLGRRLQLRPGPLRGVLRHAAGPPPRASAAHARAPATPSSPTPTRACASSSASLN